MRGGLGRIQEQNRYIQMKNINGWCFPQTYHRDTGK